MGRRREPNDQEACIRVAEPRDAARPVGVVAVGRSLLFADLFAPFDKALALATGPHVVSENR